MKGVNEATGAHVLPIAGIGVDEGGRVHIHAALCLDRYVKYKSVHREWRCGFSWEQLYRVGDNGVPYILNGHDYIPVSKPYCPRTSKCRGKKGCRTIGKPWDFVRQAIELSGRGDPCVVAPIVDDETPVLSKPPPNLKVSLPGQVCPVPNRWEPFRSKGTDSSQKISQITEMSNKGEVMI